MNEKEFVKEVVKKLRTELSGFEITINEALLYKLFLDKNQKINPTNFETPTRANYAFQTDILIKKNGSPLVVIEAKYGGVSTHDILTYSTKAIRHKEIYPQLRYGLLIGAKKEITRKCFIHNTGFDFIMAMPDTKNDNIKEFVEIIKKQINASEFLQQIFEEKIKPKKFESIIKH